MQIPPEIWPVVGVLGAAVVSWLGVRTKAQGDKEIAEKANQPNWQGFTDSAAALLGGHTYAGLST